MSKNFDRRGLGYYDTISQMVLRKTGQNQVAVCAGGTTLGDGGGGVFFFIRNANLVADDVDIFAATGAGGSDGFWVRVTASAQDFTALAVATAALAAYTRTGTTITANANGAMGAVFDGVTIAAGDTVLLPEGIAAAVADAGPYEVESVGSASTPFVLTRPGWWPDGGFVPEKKPILIKRGTLFAGTNWRSWVTTGTVVIGTSAPLLFPIRVMQSVTLVAGTATITNVPIRSATLSRVDCNSRQVGNTPTATTGGYHSTVANANGITIGNLGTASIVIQATVAAGTINNADISTLAVVIEN